MPTGEQEEASPALPGPALACPPTFDRRKEGGREKEGDDEIAGKRGPFAQFPLLSAGREGGQEQ